KLLSLFAVPLVAKGKTQGVLIAFHRLPFHPPSDWTEFLITIGGQLAIAIDNITMFEELNRSYIELTLAYDTTIEGWAQALELRDQETEGHTRRVADLTVKLAQALWISSEDLIHIRRGALLHDIGKMGIPDQILLKPGPLTEEEWEIMKKHPVYAWELLSPIKYLRPALDIPYCHHERWDGTGYPRGLKGEEIPLSARIFSVVDVWDALTSDRPYRPAWTREKALEYIKEQAGHHFDPQVAERFLELLQEFSKE
ncbi:MAG TPA: HD domain-containing phosphohydrolase, partial [bacterium]|nr:HD domain-containing phosphohydrolase [bacterium]